MILRSLGRGCVCRKSLWAVGIEEKSLERDPNPARGTSLPSPNLDKAKTPLNSGWPGLEYWKSGTTKRLSRPDLTKLAEEEIITDGEYRDDKGIG